MRRERAGEGAGGAMHPNRAADLSPAGPHTLLASPSVAKKVRVMAAFVNSSVTSVLDACGQTSMVCKHDEHEAQDCARLLFPGKV